MEAHEADLSLIERITEIRKSLHVSEFQESAPSTADEKWCAVFSSCCYWTFRWISAPSHSFFINILLIYLHTCMNSAIVQVYFLVNSFTVFCSLLWEVCKIHRRRGIIVVNRLISRLHVMSYIWFWYFSDLVMPPPPDGEKLGNDNECLYVQQLREKLKSLDMVNAYYCVLVVYFNFFCPCSAKRKCLFSTIEYFHKLNV